MTTTPAAPALPDAAAEVEAGVRFGFGGNWSRFLREIDDHRIELAERSLCDMLGVTTLAGKRFLDIGSGSGLFSLAARRLGATVHSFDFDRNSVACTTELRRRYFPSDPQWTIESGSALDQAYVDSLGKFDIVYSWGVLHHTGAMYTALANAARPVAPDGQLFVAIYNDQGRISRAWLWVKRAYNWLPRALRWIVLWPATVYLWGPATLRDLVLLRPFATWRNYPRIGVRGMSAWRDVVDWVGGLPFEVARPDVIFDFYRQRGFQLQRLTTCTGGGCNEFVFRQDQLPPA